MGYFTTSLNNPIAEFCIYSDIYWNFSMNMIEYNNWRNSDKLLFVNESISGE
jgi:hypothetical protein